MKKFVCVFLAMIALISYVKSQKQEIPAAVSLPIDSLTHLITYEGVIQVTGTKADALYSRANGWFKKYYKNPQEVVRENDSLKFKIVGKPRFKIYNPPDKDGMKTDAGNIQYTITVAAKDGRFKYVLTEFNWKQPSYYPAERWMDTKAQSYSKAYAEYLKQLNQYVQDLINEMKESVSKAKAVKDQDNW